MDREGGFVLLVGKTNFDLLKEKNKNKKKLWLKEIL